jgi:hypothetical protein
MSEKKELQTLNYRGIFQKLPKEASEGKYDYVKERKILWGAATGHNGGAYLTKFLFVYLAGLIAARKQFIPNYAYFLNSHYNWLYSSKYLLGGFLLGSFISTFTFGHPFLLEDFVRGYFRALTYMPIIERQNDFR